MNLPSFVLASASPARYKLLKLVGIDPVISRSDFDESQVKSTKGRELVETLALAKAKVVAERFDDSLILGCDSVLQVGEEIYGKPESPEDAIARWQKMRGQQGTLYTGHALIDQRQGIELIDCGKTTVYFANIDDETITAYVATGEPLKCAGSFALEGKGGLFVERLEGCHSNVIGLSLPLLRSMVSQLGYEVTDFWTSPERNNLS
jgi:septum formation protein